MSSVNPVELDQNRDLAVEYVEAGKFCYRYAYARSADSRSNNESGQDFLTFFTNGSRFTFALCDGVSQSFYGDLASRLLGRKLQELLWGLDFDAPEENIHNELANELTSLTDNATMAVKRHPIPENIPPLLNDVLEKKRALGSESTFVSGTIDFHQGKAFFTWMGDSRLHLWRGEQEYKVPFEGTFQTSERWSTKKGLVGDLHTKIVSLDKFNHLAVYSDGFSQMDTRYAGREQRPFSDHAVNAFINDDNKLPSSDDISFLELWLLPPKPSFPIEAENLAPPPVSYQRKGDFHFLSWKPIKGATSYEVRVSSNAGTLSTAKTEDLSWQHPDTLQPNASLLSVRAFWRDEPGEWSDSITLQRGNFRVENTPAPNYEPSLSLFSPPPLQSQETETKGATVLHEPASTLKDSASNAKTFDMPKNRGKIRNMIIFGGITSCLGCLIFGLLARSNIINVLNFRATTTATVTETFTTTPLKPSATSTLETPTTTLTNTLTLTITETPTSTATAATVSVTSSPTSTDTPTATSTSTFTVTLETPQGDNSQSSVIDSTKTRSHSR